MLEYAAHLLNRYEVGRDGRTAYERLKAKKAKPLGMEFGELVQWRTRPIGSGALGKLDSVWDHGVFLGVKGKTGEIVIGARSGIFKARTVRRRSTEDRWNPKAMELVTGVPWRTSEDDDKVDGEKFAKLQVPEEAIRKHDEDVKKERDGPRVDAKKLLYHKEGYGTAWVLGEVPRMRISHPRDHPPGALRGVQDEIRGNSQEQKYKRVEGEVRERGQEHGGSTEEVRPA